ncbi:MAG: glycosyltransferase family 2 protein [Paracoccaceae bacterium]
MPEFVIAICTRERPQMLAELLHSCTNLAPVEGLDLRFIIVESGPDTPSLAVIESLSEQLAITYAHEPRIGVVRARNCAIEQFLQGSGDWLAFIDDDEVIDPNWAVAMYAAIVAMPAYNIFAGRAIMKEPDTAPRIFKALEAVKKRRNEPADLKAVTTQNIVFRRSVFADDGRAMRFDLRFNTIGGSDFFLSYQLTDSGEKIRFVPDAITREDILPERAAFGFRMGKQIAQAHHRGLMSVLRFGLFRGHLHNIWAALSAFVWFMLLSLQGAVVLVFNEQRGLVYFARAMNRLSIVIGRPRILWRNPVDIYDKVQGS